MADNDLLIEIKGSAKEFVEALDLVKDKSGKLEDQYKTLGLVSGAVWASTTAEIGLATAAYGRQEISVSKLSQTLQAQGLYSDELRDSYVQAADAIERKTGVEASAIISGQGLLQTMIGQIPITAELTQGVVDLAARTGQDLSAAFELVGKGINGHAKELKNLGIEVDGNASRSERLAEITRQLSTSFHGAAEANASGLGGYRQLHAVLDEVQKNIGEAFAPAVSEAIHLLSEFFGVIADHKGITDLIASLAAGALVFGGLVASASAAGFAILKVKEIMSLATIAMDAMGIAAQGLAAATGIGILVVIATEVYLHWNTVWPAVQATFISFVHGITELSSGLGKVIQGAFTLNPSKIKEGLDQVKSAIANDLDETKSIYRQKQGEMEQDHKTHIDKQNSASKAAADKREAERKSEEDRHFATVKAENSLIQSETERDSAATIALKRAEVEILKKLEDDKYKGVRGSLVGSLQENRGLQKQQHELDLTQEQEYNDKFTEQSEAYGQMSAEQKREFNQKNGNELKASIQTEATTRDKAAKDEVAANIKQNNDFLANEQKFGKAYATIKKITQSEIYQGQKQAFGELAQLEQSSNATLKEIGKAASIANIVMKTAESAMNVYAGFSTIPFIGPALGIAAAGAVIAYGAEQVGTVVAAADGGLMTGGIPGQDSIHTVTMPGELIVPTNSYEDVISAEVYRRRGENMGSQNAAPSYAHVELSLKDSLMNFIEAKLVERKNLGFSYQGAN